MARKGYSLGSLTDYVNTKFNIAGGEITGDMNVKGILKEKGQRVYSPNNKPTPADIGAVSKAGDRMSGTLYNTKNDAFAFLAERNGTGAGFGCSNIKGEFIFGGRQTTSGDYTQYIRMGVDKLKWHNKGAEYDIYHVGNKPTPEAIGAANVKIYQGDGFKLLGSTQGPAPDYKTRYYKVCEYTGKSRMDYSFDVYVHADTNSTGSIGRSRINVSRYEGESAGALHVMVSALDGNTNMVRVWVKQEAGKTTVWASAGRIWGSVYAQKVGSPNTLPAPAEMITGYNVFSDDPLVTDTTLVYPGSTWDCDDKRIKYIRFDGSFYDNNHRVYSPANKPTPAELGALATTGGEVSGVTTFLNSIVLKGGGRRHIVIKDPAGEDDAYLSKDVGVGNSWRIATKSTDWEMSDKGYHLINASSYRNNFAGGWNTQVRNPAPSTVFLGGTTLDSYYPLFRGVSALDGHGYTTHIDLGTYRKSTVDWAVGILRVGSHESATQPSANFEFHVTGDFKAGLNGNFNDVYIRSDKRLKSDKTPLTDALDKVCTLQGYTYTKHKSLSDDTIVGREAGILAQDLEKVLPEATHTAKDTQMTISNSGVNALLVEAIKELRAELAELKAHIGES